MAVYLFSKKATKQDLSRIFREIKKQRRKEGEHGTGNDPGTSVDNGGS